MSENQEVDVDESSSAAESADDLFLSPDDSDGEEIVIVGPDGEETPISAGAPVQAAAPQAAAAPPAPTPAAPAVDTAAAAAQAEKIAALEAERDDLRNRMMRSAADLENYRKRTLREKDEMRKYGIDRVVLELLPVLDNLDRALEHADKSEDSTTIVDGVRMVQRQFVTALEKHGVKGFDSRGEAFDPQLHEAIQQVETTDHPNGTVMDEYQRGYYLHDRLIRPAMVVVARNSAPAPPPAEDASEGAEASEPAEEAAVQAQADESAEEETPEVSEPVEEEPVDAAPSSDADSEGEEPPAAN